MIFQKLHYFVTVAEYGSINQAAEHLFISQQSLRAAMNSLEESLGFSLFLRSSRGVQLTECGKAFLSDARQILSIAENWKHFSDGSTLSVRPVMIVASTEAYNTVLTDVISESRTRQPNLRINFFHARNDEIIQKLDKNSVGVIASAPEGVVSSLIRPIAEPIGLQVESFGLDQFCIYLNADHPLANKPSLTTDDLKALTLATYPGADAHFYYNAIFRHFNDIPPYFIEKQENIFKMISEQSDLAGIFPRIAAVNNQYVEQGLIKTKYVRNFSMPSVSCVVYPRSEAMTPELRSIVDLIYEKIDSLLHKLNQTP